MRLLVTRPAEQNSALIQKLESEGNEVISLPMIVIEPPADGGTALRSSLAKIETFDWMVLASANAVRAVATLSIRLPNHLKILCVGSSTFETAQKLGGQPILQEEGEGAEGILAYFSKINIKGKKILLPRSAIGRDELPMGLQKMGAEVTAVEAYQTVPSNVTGAEIQKVFAQGIDGIYFYSPSAVRAFFEKIKGLSIDLKKVRIFTIGKTTEAAFLSLRGQQSTTLEE